MDAQHFERQAEAIYQAFPFWNGLDSESRSEFQQRLAIDLAKIALICGYADGVFDELEEEFCDAVFSRLLEPKSATGESSSDTILLDRQACFERARREGREHLFLPAMVRKYDQQHGTSIFDRVAYALYRFGSFLVKADGHVTDAEAEALKSVWRSIHSASSVASMVGGVRLPEPGQQTPEQVLAELDRLVGLNEVKNQVRTLVNLLEAQAERSRRGISTRSLSLHTAFLGPPGTGKSRVARLLGKVYRSLSILPSGHLIETDAASLVVASPERTRRRVTEAIDAAVGGLLMIDNTGRLAPALSDSGSEAVAALLAGIAEHRGNLGVIVAGHSDDLAQLFMDRPGLAATFGRRLSFEDLGPDQLLQIYERFCQAGGFSVTEPAMVKLRMVLDVLHENRGYVYGNARLVRNLFDRSIERHANRIASIAPLTDEILTTLSEDDIPPSSFVPLAAEMA